MYDQLANVSLILLVDSFTVCWEELLVVTVFSFLYVNNKILCGLSYKKWTCDQFHIVLPDFLF